MPRLCTSALHGICRVLVYWYMRPTKTFTPEGSKDVFIIKTYATAQDKRDVQESYDLQVAKLPPEQREMTSKVYAALQDASIKMMLVSINDKVDGQDVDGTPFDSLKFLLALPSDQFDAVFAQIKESLDGEKKRMS